MPKSSFSPTFGFGDSLQAEGLFEREEESQGGQRGVEWAAQSCLERGFDACGEGRVPEDPGRSSIQAGNLVVVLSPEMAASLGVTQRYGAEGENHEERDQDATA